MESNNNMNRRETLSHIGKIVVGGGLFFGLLNQYESDRLSGYLNGLTDPNDPNNTNKINYPNTDTIPDPDENSIVIEQEILNSRLNIFEGYEDPLFKLYDESISNWTEYWNGEFKNHVSGFRLLDPNLAKAMVLQESGGHKETAYLHDPMQIANKGDYALRVLRDGLEDSIPRGGYKDLQGITETPGHFEIKKYIDRKGKTREKRIWVWEYKESDNRISSDLSIKYGIRWLFQKVFVFDERTTVDMASPMRTYTVKYGDSVSEIAVEHGTTTNIIVKYNNIDNPNKIFAGQELKYRPAIRMAVIVGMRPWEDAVERYNGGGTPGYKDMVYEKLRNSSNR